MVDVWALLPAGGQGRRFGSTLAKQYLPLAGSTVLAHALAPFLQETRIRGVQLVLPAADIDGEAWRELITAQTERLLPPVAGGAERQDSVRLGLQALLARGAEAADWVLVHDAARPCLRQQDLRALLDALPESPQGILLALPVADTLKRAEADRAVATVDRRQLWRALTPQAFPLGALLQALDDARAADAVVTDEASALERLGWQPRLLAAHADNLKITYPEDLPLAEAILAARRET
ncbi:2-C-methyl-D-erythritol 4-phosphate cytidylyltransferase [Candidatus Igneacidithiobacillus taiwanensis]|uniref:2-C-methyl-D-erythritol 4-phosphate cytidylyltransferase n=1 Tax=Candidatus Igneacidithiobacillus taiwanensis TaxID=1945924 RepID=UPI0028A0E296|nr:2-C-methyl-D-erythritol 4-phosphate cytidylyltransferase [Candidatus Igneacidithiobacillus taiwanensis]MCE5360156.1 2-C-methyl-D-erythritol 4-phosphate cytidylyltransferase [Acidithiobacillus sp.]